jgi:hypothetical protein
MGRALPYTPFTGSAGARDTYRERQDTTDMQRSYTLA